MSMMYVAPEQQMKDRADFARKGIARGRSVVVLRYADGICFVAENRSQALHKVSEIYDRIGFAAVGRYNEFENLRIAGIRHADLRGYSYDRADVTGRGLANAYAQLLGTIFSAGGEKPYEVEIVVAELGESSEEDQIYRLTYDGSVGDEERLVHAQRPRRAPRMLEYIPQGRDVALEPDDRRRCAPERLGTPCERIERAGRRLHGYEVGGDMACRHQPTRLVEAPDLTAEPTRLHLSRLDPVLDEGVHDGVVVDQLAQRRQVVGTQCSKP